MSGESVPPWVLGRDENSKTCQNQMSQSFFIVLYDIATGDGFYFFQKKIFIGGNGFQNNPFLHTRNGHNEPQNHQN